MQDDQEANENTKLILYRLDEYNSNLKEHLITEKESWTQFDGRLMRVEATQTKFLSGIRYVKWTISIIGTFLVFKWTEAIDTIKKLITLFK